MRAVETTPAASLIRVMTKVTRAMATVGEESAGGLRLDLMFDCKT